jgi:membrane protease YdiL (CAAX protease family)
MNVSFYWIAVYSALCVWLVAGWRFVYQALFSAKSAFSSNSFFSLKDLFLHLIFLTLAIFGYLGSFSVAKYIVQEMPGGFISQVFLGKSQESQLMIQAIGTPCAVLFLWFLNSLLPDGMRKRIVSSSNSWQDWLKGIGLGIILWPALASIVWVLQFVVGFYHLPSQQHLVESLLGIIDRPVFLTIMSLEIILLVPFLEELLFRGYLLSFLKGTIHPFLAYVFSSLIFAWMHFSVAQQASNYAFLPALFLFGLCAALIREKTSLSRISGLHSGVTGTSVLVLLSGVTR